MKTLQFKKLAAAVGLLLACATGSAQAANTDLGLNFTFDGSSLGGGVITNVDSQNFRYAATVDQQQTGAVFLDGNDQFTESGFMSFSAFQNDAGSAILGSGLNNSFAMYALFKATGTAGLDANGTGILASFSSFELQFFIDDAGDTTFDSSNTTAFPSRGNFADDQQFASATLIEASQAHIFGGLANGDFQVNMTDFGLNLFGSTLYTSPNPFYQKFYFTGVTTQVGPEANIINPFKTGLTGSGDLAFVPEPESTSLLGIGLLALGLASSRRRIQKQA